MQIAYLLSMPGLTIICMKGGRDMGGRTSNESKAKYNAKAYDRINIAVPKGRKAELQAVAERHGQSVNGFINSLIDEAMEREQAQQAGGGFGISKAVQEDIS